MSPHICKLLSASIEITTHYLLIFIEKSLCLKMLIQSEKKAEQTWLFYNYIAILAILHALFRRNGL